MPRPISYAVFCLKKKKSTSLKLLSGIYPYGSYDGNFFIHVQLPKLRSVADARNTRLAVIYFLLAIVTNTEIYTLSLHDALPILILLLMPTLNFLPVWFALSLLRFRLPSRLPMKTQRSEERFSRNAETDLVCRLLLEKKKIDVAKVAVGHLPVRFLRRKFFHSRATS